MSELSPAPRPFAYQAQSLDGRRASGAIDASGIDDARAALAAMNLRVLDLRDAESGDGERGGAEAGVADRGDHGAGRGQPLGAEDFLAFNQQLTQLASAGMPLEQGLRLAADDLRRGPLARAARGVAEELERGRSLADAVAAHRGQFPPAYAALVDAGVRSGTLPGLLANFGRHALMIERLRAAAWRASAYPLAVTVLLGVVMAFVFLRVMPIFSQMFALFGDNLPALTRAMLAASRVIGAAAALGAGLLVLGLLAWAVLRRSGRARAAAERALSALPLVGPAVRRSVAARWCDVVRLGVEAGMDLPAAIALASDAIAQPAVAADSREMIDVISAGRPLGDASHPRVLPATVAAAMELGAARGDLGGALANLVRLYQSQAELRLAAVQGALTPMLLLVVSLLIGLCLLAVMAPMLSLIGAMW